MPSTVFFSSFLISLVPFLATILPPPWDNGCPPPLTLLTFFSPGNRIARVEIADFHFQTTLARWVDESQVPLLTVTTPAVPPLTAVITLEGTDVKFPTPPSNVASAKSGS